MNENSDIVMIVTSLIFATLSIFYAYGIIPMTSQSDAMFCSGSLATGASFIFLFGCLRALKSRECIYTHGAAYFHYLT